MSCDNAQPSAPNAGIIVSICLTAAMYGTVAGVSAARAYNASRGTVCADVENRCDGTGRTIEPKTAWFLTVRQTGVSPDVHGRHAASAPVAMGCILVTQPMAVEVLYTVTFVYVASGFSST